MPNIENYPNMGMRTVLLSGCLKRNAYSMPIKSTYTREIISRRKQRSAFDQASDFDRGRILAYRDIVDYLSGKSVVVLDETKQQ
ncbi:hypothetical protein TNCV_4516231 [Trichonephila clavipes]|nr:hypothetical protein TNCV_4516231 [Trichonephila clavipes]